jgi:hypothetical protein
MALAGAEEEYRGFRVLSEQPESSEARIEGWMPRSLPWTRGREWGGLQLQGVLCDQDMSGVTLTQRS